MSTHDDDLHGATPASASSPSASGATPGEERNEPHFDSAAPAAAAPAPTPVMVMAPAPRRRAGWTFFKWWFAISAVIALVCVVGLFTALNHIGDTPMHVIVDGEEVGSGIHLSLGAMPVAHQVAAACAIVLAVVILLFVVPLTVVIGLLAVVLALVAGLGLPLIALALAFTVVTSPIWLVGVLVWMVVRANRRAAALAAAAAASGSATIRA